jgi:LytS/YehU family sensor histidine kinase
MEFLRGYLEIESIRFQDRLQVTLDIEPETLNAHVPNLILQPIVENSIKYAIVMRAAAGHIQIRAQCRNGTLRLQVQDDGPGLHLPPRGNIASRGVGLTNTEARLKQLYGNAHKFELLNVPEGGLLVTLELPLKHEH